MFSGVKPAANTCPVVLNAHVWAPHADDVGTAQRVAVEKNFIILGIGVADF